MVVVALFLPSFISMAIYRKRSNKVAHDWQAMIVRYGIYVLLNTWIAQDIITYLLGQGQITESALTSFPFFTKYVVITSVCAVILPYIEEMIKKCMGVSVDFLTDDEK